MTRTDAEDKSAAVPWRSPTVQVVLMSTILAPLGVPLIAPALPVVRDAFGGSVTKSWTASTMATSHTSRDTNESITIDRRVVNSW